MATAFAHKHTKSGDAKRKTQDSRESAAAPRDDDIPVLIRLPDLSEELAGDQRLPEPGSGEQHSDSASVRQPLWDGAGGGAAAEATSAGTTPQDTAAEKPQASAAADFGRLRLVGQLAVAALMIGLFAAAYLAIVGPGGRSRDAGTGAPTAESRDEPLVIDQGTPWTPGPAAKPEPPVAAAPAALTTLPPSQGTAPEQGDKDKPAAKPAPETPGPPTGPPLVTSPPEGSSPAPRAAPAPPRDRTPATPDTRPAPSARDWTPPGTPPATSANRPPEAPAGTPANRTLEMPGMPTTGTSPPPAGSLAAGASPRSSVLTPVPLSRYPVTDPASFRYPERYHEALAISSTASRPPNDAAGHRERDFYDRGTNTARMNQRMDPPPLR